MQLGKIRSRIEGGLRHKFGGHDTLTQADELSNGVHQPENPFEQIATLAYDAVIGVNRENGADAGGIVRNAIASVISYTDGASPSDTVVFRYAVSGAITGSRSLDAPLDLIGRGAAEGAILGAASTGANFDDVMLPVSQGAIDALRDLGGDIRGTARSTIQGVIAGVRAANGDVVGLSQMFAQQFVKAAAETEEEVEEASRGLVEGALEGNRNAGAEVDASDLVAAVTLGAVQAAYDVSHVAGDSVQRAALDIVERRSGFHSPLSIERYRELMARLSESLETQEESWRLQAMWDAGRSLFEKGGLDLSASLAYFMLLSFFPLMALMVIGFAMFADPEIIRERLLEILVFYFPASQEFLTSAIEHLFDAGLAAGVIAIVGMFLGANGLFMATNRSVNRVFGVHPRRMLSTTLLEVGLAIIVVLIFLLSLSLTIVFQIAFTVSEAIPSVGGSVSGVLLLATQLLSATLPVLLTAAVFSVVYHTLPNTEVSWGDAIFGAIVAVILFEGAKNLFFWFGAIASQRSLLYGPISSVIIVLVWSNLAGLIFLYGASLARESGNHHPSNRIGDIKVVPSNEAEISV